MNHASQMGLLNPVQGSKSINSKLTEDIVRYCREVHIDKHPLYSKKALSEKFDVHITAIQKAIDGITWKHVK